MAERAHRLAHGLIKKRRNDSTVQKAGVALKGFRDNREADDGAVRSEQELQAQPV
jgi:hypothetical protein